MFGLLERALKTALKDCEQAEIYAERSRVLSIDFEKGKVKRGKVGENLGIGIRVVLSKKVGFSYTTSAERLEECIAAAIRQAKASETDEAFEGLPQPSKGYSTPERTFDEAVVALSAGAAVELCESMISAALEKGVKTVEGGFSAGYDEVFVLSSEGVKTQDRATFVSGSLTAIASSAGGEEVAAWEGTVSHFLQDFDAEFVGREAASVAVASLGGERCETRKMPVVLTPKSLQSLLPYTTIAQLNAENVQKKQSPYYKKKNESIASEILTILDDGTLPGGLNTRKMDGEGIASQKTMLVECGVLKNFLYDSYTATKDNVESTGNAVRSYDTLPRVGATNFVLTAEELLKKEELLGEIKEGLLVHDLIGAHTASRASGEFSVVAYNAFIVRRGELRPAKNVMLAGASTEILKNVVALADDVRQLGSVVSPSILVKNIQVVSA